MAAEQDGGFDERVGPPDDLPTRRRVQRNTSVYVTGHTWFIEPEKGDADAARDRKSLFSPSPCGFGRVVARCARNAPVKRRGIFTRGESDCGDAGTHSITSKSNGRKRVVAV